MDKKQAIRIAENYIKVVEAIFPVEKAILFGSFAKGDFSAYSDIDIAIVWEFKADLFQMQLELMRLRRGVDLRIEPHAFNAGDFSISDPLVFEILKHGIEINKKMEAL